jgi:SAM-dependent methyltransferase
MPTSPKLIHITLDPPYRLDETQTTFAFNGWAQVDDATAPKIELSLNGVKTPVNIYEMPELAELFPGMKGVGFWANVTFRNVLPQPPADRPFLLIATVTSDDRQRSFEYAVSQAWLDKVFDQPPAARPTPPEHLQIRVTGAAAGAFHAAGQVVAERIAELVSASGQPLPAYERVLDFGCGCGRVISAIADMHPEGRLSASDIDEEAIAWNRANLGRVADFRPNDHQPPLPFEDGAFDLVYGISVFTHLPEDLQWAWLEDLRRVVRPGGVVLTTKLNHASYDLPAAVKAEGAKTGFVYWGDADATEGLPGFYRLAYHSHDYVRQEWSRYFDVLQIGSHDLNGTQDSVLLRRRPD